MSLFKAFTHPRPTSSSAAKHSLLAYWLHRSAWHASPEPRRRLRTAVDQASTQSCAGISSSNTYPKTVRAYQSMRTAW